MHEVPGQGFGGRRHAHERSLVFRLVSLNLNGIRSAASKGFVEWAQGVGADCMGVQEVRAQQPDVAGKFDRVGPLAGHFHFAERKGYAGVGLYTRSASPAM